MKRIIYLPLLCMSLLVFSCSSSEDNPVQSSITEEEAAEIMKMDQLSREKRAYEELLNNLLTETETGEKVPHYGVRLDESSDEYSLEVSTLEEAKEIFLSIIPWDDDIVEDGKTMIYQVGAAKIVFDENYPEGVAKMTIDCPDLPDYHTLNFIYPMSNYIPIEKPDYVDQDVKSPFKLASVWKKDGKYYICVKESSGTTKGIMLTFDVWKGGGIEGREETHHNGWITRTVKGYKGQASETALREYESLCRYNTNTLTDKLFRFMLAMLPTPVNQLPTTYKMIVNDNNIRNYVPESERSNIQLGTLKSRYQEHAPDKEIQSIVFGNIWGVNGNGPKIAVNDFSWDSTYHYYFLYWEQDTEFWQDYCYFNKVAQFGNVGNATFDTYYKKEANDSQDNRGKDIYQTFASSIEFSNSTSTSGWVQIL